MIKYFLHNGKEQEGPYDLAELKTKIIKKDTPIWYEDLPQWTTADKASELSNLITHSLPPPFESKIIVDSNKKKKRSKTWLIVILSLCLCIFVLTTYFFLIPIGKNKSNRTKDNFQEMFMSMEEIERARPTDFLNIDGMYKVNFWGTKFKINLIITNTASETNYKDAVVRITYYSKAETALGSEDFTIYETFKPRTPVGVDLNMEIYKDVSSFRWKIIKAKSK